MHSLQRFTANKCGLIFNQGRDRSWAILHSNGCVQKLDQPLLPTSTCRKQLDKQGRKSRPQWGQRRMLFHVGHPYGSPFSGLNFRDATLDLSKNLSSLSNTDIADRAQMQKEAHSFKTCLQLRPGPSPRCWRSNQAKEIKTENPQHNTESKKEECQAKIQWQYRVQTREPPNHHSEGDRMST